MGEESLSFPGFPFFARFSLQFLRQELWEYTVGSSVFPTWKHPEIKGSRVVWFESSELARWQNWMPSWPRHKRWWTSWRTFFLGGAAGLVLLNKRVISNIIIISVYVYSAKENTDLTPRCLEMVPSSKRILAFPATNYQPKQHSQQRTAQRRCNDRWTPPTSCFLVSVVRMHDGLGKGCRIAEGWKGEDAKVLVGFYLIGFLGMISDFLLMDTSLRSEAFQALAYELSLRARWHCQDRGFQKFRLATKEA